jgi:hypothetical protein
VTSDQGPLRNLMDSEPSDEAEGILRDQFYGQHPHTPEKPLTYKVVCISLYNEDIARLDALVAELKRRGHTRASKSAVIRHALETLQIDKIPKKL